MTRTPEFPFEALLLLSAIGAERGDLPGVDVGVGPVRAGIGAARALAGSRARGVLLIGTAGAYGTGLALGAVVVAGAIGLERGVAEVGLGYAPLAPGDHRSDPGLVARLGLPVADVLTVGAITTDPGLVAARGASWQVEHMEAWAVAEAAAREGLPFAAVLGISNRVGPDAHAEWLAHRGRAEAAAREAVLRAFPARSAAGPAQADDA